MAPKPGWLLHFTPTFTPLIHFIHYHSLCWKVKRTFTRQMSFSLAACLCLHCLKLADRLCMHLQNNFTCVQVALYLCVGWQIHLWEVKTHKSLCRFVNLSLCSWIIPYAFVNILRLILHHWNMRKHSLRRNDNWQCNSAYRAISWHLTEHITGCSKIATLEWTAILGWNEL